MQLLLRGYDVYSDPVVDDCGGRVTPDSGLRASRDHAFWLLLNRDDAEASAAAERLAALDRGLAGRLREYRARHAAAGLLAGLPSTNASSGPAVPLGEAVRLLDDADYRLVQSADDLLAAVCEALRLVDRQVAYDLPMLYGAPPGEKGAARQHLHEDALQAYVRRRLADLLPGRVLASQVRTVAVAREEQVRYRRRLDLCVTAPCRGRQDLAKVVIEVKWSDNVETETSLVDQLGRKYLLGEGLTHGVYLVGWCGRWRRTGHGALTERGELEAYLAGQRDTFCAESAPGHGLRIEPVVLGLGWRDAEAEA